MTGCNGLPVPRVRVDWDGSYAGRLCRTLVALREVCLAGQRLISMGNSRVWGICDSILRNRSPFGGKSTPRGTRADILVVVEYVAGVEPTGGLRRRGRRRRGSGRGLRRRRGRSR